MLTIRLSLHIHMDTSATFVYRIDPRCGIESKVDKVVLTTNDTQKLVVADHACAVAFILTGVKNIHPFKVICASTENVLYVSTLCNMRNIEKWQFTQNSK